MSRHLAFAALAAVASAAPAPTFAVQRERLPNGLTVVLAPDASASSVVVAVRYDVGAADESAAEAGFTHAVERLLFAGTRHVADFDARVEAAGGWTTSETALDHVRTAVQVPPGALELALWLEADRMAHVADAIDDAELARMREAIAGERRAAYDDHPYALVARAVQQALWANEPNAQLVLAEPQGSAGELAAFARRWFSPGNATLVVAGKLDVARTAPLVERYFGGLAAVAPPGHSTKNPVPLDRAAARTVTDPIAKVVVAFRAPEPWAEGDAELEVGARILAGGRASRLGRALDAAGLASDVHVELVRQRRGGELRLVAIARDGVDPARLVAPIERALGELRDAPATADELSRAVAGLELDTMLALEAMPYRADVLAWNTDDPVIARRARLRAVTADSLQRVARTWLAANAAVTVVGTPEAHAR